jgi:hypothetical protein
MSCSGAALTSGNCSSGSDETTHCGPDLKCRKTGKGVCL